MSAILAFPTVASAPVAILLALLGFLIRRSGPRALSLWLFAWSTLLAAATMGFLARELPGLYPISFLFSSMTPALMLMGARAHVGRRVPTQLLGVAATVAILRLTFYQLGDPVSPQIIAALFEPSLGLLAAWTIATRSRAPTESRSTGDSAMILLFMAYAGIEATDALSRIQLDGEVGLGVWIAWCITSLSLFASQLAPYLQHFGTQAREQERRARSYARRLQVMTSESRDALIEVDAFGTILYATPNLAEFGGHRPEEIIGRNALELFDSRNGSALARMLEEKGRLEEADIAGLSPEVQLISMPDDSKRWFESSGVTYRTPDDELRILIRTRDVTERIRLEGALRKGEERLRLLADSNVVGVFYARTDGTITEANEAFLSLLGYTRNDLPLSWRALTPSPDLLARDLAARDELTRDGGVLPYEKEFLTRSGDRVVTLLGGASLPDEMRIFIAVDQSERKRAEALIARHQRELEEQVELRTRELVESRSRLIETERLAAVGTLAAGVAHQINNPIGAILNSAEYALLCRDDENAQDVFEQALQDNRTEARRCAQIVRSMLQFSRDEPTTKWVDDLNSVIRRAYRAITAYAKDRGARVSLDAPEDKVFALISPIEIEQAIVNVLRNAIESSERGANVTLALAAREEIAEIEVRDDGRGVAELDRDRLFEPFFSTRTRDGGTGLGLSVAHGVLTDHGGTIRIEALPEGGTRVIISLPLVDKTLATVELPEAATR